MLITQTPRRPVETERVSVRYPVSLQLHYRVKSKPGPVEGFGQTRMMSSQDIVFVPSDGLKPGMNAEIVVDWPPLLDDRHLQLVLQVTITGSQNGEAEGRIRTYDFRTRGPAEGPLIWRYSGAALGPGRVARYGARTTAWHLRRSGP